MHIQIQQDGLAFQTREADVHTVGQTGAAATVQAGFRDVLEDAVDDIIAQLALVGHALIQMQMCIRDRPMPTSPSGGTRP